MTMPSAYRKIRIVNPEWIYYFKLAHSNHASGTFTPSFITPDSYIVVDVLL